MVIYTKLRREVHSLNAEEFLNINRGNEGFYNTIFTGEVISDRDSFITSFLDMRVRIMGNSFYSSPQDSIQENKFYRFIIRHGPIHGFFEDYFKGSVFRALESEEDDCERIVPGFKFPVLRECAWREIPADIDPSDTTVLRDMQFMRAYEREIKERMLRRRLQQAG